MKRIPMVPFPLSKAIKFSKPFLGFAEKFVSFFPELKLRLVQAEIEISDREYVALALFSSFFWFILIFSLFLLVGVSAKFQNFLLISLISSFAISFMSFLYILFYPSLLISRKVKDLEKNLLFALRHLLIQVKSGVSLFDAMVSVSRGNYGLVSKEFEKCTKNIATGKPEIDALEELSLKNPSLFFRRTIWQLANAMRAGADVGDALSVLVENLSNEQRVAIRRYGSQLNPLALIYMMIAVIIPTLGITFLFILSSFTGFAVSEAIFYLLLIFLAIFQFSFIGMVKSRRPPVEV